VSTSPIRVIVVDDHTLLLEAVSEVLQLEDDIEVVGTTGDGPTAVAMATRLRPDVLLLDIELPGNTFDVTLPRILSASPRTATVALSMHDGAGLVREVLAAGARGYLHKSVNRQDLVAAIRSVHRDPRRVVVSVSQSGFHDSAPAGTAGAESLSAREQELLALVAKAMSNRQIARQMSITEGTVKRHLRNIFGKLGAVSRIDAVNKAALIVRPEELPAPRAGQRSA
jgi:DNA-binding NarL/FixJ family response regulator